MAKLIKPEECPKCMPGWLAAFGDLMSLLLCFFVLLLSMSTMDAKKLEYAVGSLAGALSVLDGGARPEVQREQETELESQVKKERLEAKSQHKDASQAVKAINELLNVAGSPEVTIRDTEDGFVVRLPASLLFAQGRAEIQNDDAKLFLKRISMIAAKLPPDVDVAVVGHTDDSAPDINSLYKDNWNLSTARAISVVNELLKDGVDPKRLVASGRASYEPVAPNTNASNKALNNRVEIRFVSLDKEKKEATQKSVLDK